jgi:hypothetical protein
MKTQVTEMNDLKYIIDKIFGVDLMKNSRQRNIVDSRLIYAKILRDRGHTFQSIGRSINKDHTTIVYYINQVDNIIKHDVRIAEKYATCKNIFLQGKPFISEKLNEADLVDMVDKLTKENEKLISGRKNVLDMRSSFRRIESIIKIIEERMQRGDEKLIEEKIIKMFNGFYQQE